MTITVLPCALLDIYLNLAMAIDKSVQLHMLCRYCSGASCAALPVLDGVCTEPECQANAKLACSKTLACGHLCGGIAGENPRLPRLKGCDKTMALKQVQIFIPI